MMGKKERTCAPARQCREFTVGPSDRVSALRGSSHVGPQFHERPLYGCRARHRVHIRCEQSIAIHYRTRLTSDRVAFDRVEGSRTAFALIGGTTP